MPPLYHHQSFVITSPSPITNVSSIYSYGPTVLYRTDANATPTATRAPKPIQAESFAASRAGQITRGDCPAIMTSLISSAMTSLTFSIMTSLTPL